jgi:hypothetical protein
VGTFLVTGLPGSGVADVGEALQSRGYNATDADKAFGYLGNRMSEVPVIFPRRADRSWFAENGWLWDTQKLRAWLLEPREKLAILYGNADNEKKFYRHFDHIFMLQVPESRLKAHLASSDNPRLSHPRFIDRTLVWNRGLEAQVKNIGATLVDADRDAEETAAEIVLLVEAEHAK